MKRLLKTNRPELILFFFLIAIAALGNGLSDSIYGNYFNEVYHVDAAQRGFIEFPRELPGFLCLLFISLIAPLGDFKAAVIAQVLACAGLTVLGLFTPAFGVMLVFLFINSTGMHLFMPLRDSIGMALAEPDQIGKRMGQYASVQSFIGMAAGLIVFFGFRTGVFTFQSDVRWMFLLGAIAFAVAAIIAVCLAKKMRGNDVREKKIKLVFRKEYKYYYLLTVLHGVQKQIAYVYGSWVIINLLQKGADIMSLLTIIASFICIFFMNLVGKWMDKFGIKKMMYVDALTFIVIYAIYGFVVWGITSKIFPDQTWAVACVYVLFILDRLSMQIGIVKSVYLRSIAVNTEEVTQTLSTGTSLDHIVSIVAAAICGVIWEKFGAQWVFFMASILSCGNLIVAWRVNPEAEMARAKALRG